MTGAGTVPNTEPDPRRWRALSVTLVAGFMGMLDVSIVSVALPSIQRGLGTDPAGAQWVVSGYALAFGLSLVPAGRLGDAIGRRRMFLASLAAFVLFSGLAGAAPTTELLIAARLAQGLAAGSLAPQNSALIQQMFRGAERGRAFGFFGTMVGVSTATGPLVGGLILSLATGPDGWRWIFLVNLPIGLAALALAARLLPRTAPGKREHIDLIGVGLLGAGVLSMLLPLVEADAGGLRRLWWLFLVGAALITLFVFWERRVVARDREPLLDLRLLSGTPGYASGVALGTTFFIGFSGIWLVLALYFQNGLGYTPLQSGLVVLPFAIGSATSAAVGGRIVGRLGRRLTVLGLLLAVLGLTGTAIVLITVPAEAMAWAVTVPLLMAGIGNGWVISPNNTMTLRRVPVRMAGSAAGAMQTGQRAGATIGSAGLAAVFYTVLAVTEFPVAAGAAIGAAVVTTTVALVIAIGEWRRGRRTEQAVVAPQPEAVQSTQVAQLAEPSAVTQPTAGTQ